MADTIPAPAAAPAPSAPTAPASPSVPDGFVQIPKTDWEKAQQWREQVTGWNKRAEEWKKGGIELDDVGRFAPTLAQAKKLGIKTDYLPDLLGTIFSQKAVEEHASPEGGKAYDPGEVQRLAEEAAEARWLAREHETSEKSARETIKRLAKELAGDGASAEQVFEAQCILKGLADEHLEKNVDRFFYDKKHPLHEKAFRPFGEDDFSAIKTRWSEFRAKSRAVETAAIGEAASRTPPKPASPPAGKPGGQGKPDTGKPSRQAWQKTPQELLAEYEAHEAKRGKATVG